LTLVTLYQLQRNNLKNNKKLKYFFLLYNPVSNILTHLIIKMSTNNDCPICMECISDNTNKIITECGHSFHCSCLMKNVVHNGVGCPYCRQMMAELPNYENDSDEESWSTETSDIMEYNTLTTFRMFHQQLDGEEPEEEPEQLEVERIIPQDNGPNYLFVANKLKEQGITFEQLVKEYLAIEYEYNHGQSDADNDKESNILYGQFNRIMNLYGRNNNRSVDRR
jgi:hypothetical protein